jgi:hypothetical protein
MNNNLSSQGIYQWPPNLKRKNTISITEPSYAWDSSSNGAKAKYPQLRHPSKSSRCSLRMEEAILPIKYMSKCAQKSIGDTLPLNLMADSSELKKPTDLSIGPAVLKERQLRMTLQQQAHQLEKEIATLRDLKRRRGTMMTMEGLNARQMKANTVGIKDN